MAERRPTGGDKGRKPRRKRRSAPRAAIRLRLPLALLLGAGGLALVVRWVVGAGGPLDLWSQVQSHRELAQRVEELRLDNRRLERDIAALRSDPERIEREARERLGYVRGGETVLLFPEHALPEIRRPSPAD